MKLPVALLLPLAVSLSAFAATPTTEIKVDQAGYLPSAPKIALLVSDSPSAAFTVKRAADGAVAFTGELSAPVEEASSGDRVRIADFTALNRAGKYYIEVEGSGRSWEFAIAPDVYSRPYYLAIRAFYGQRCGTAVDLGPEFPGYKYAACHLEGAYHPTSGKSGARPPSGGWHDAGDYGRYVVNSGITTGTLLWTWELFAKRTDKIKLNLPESGNSTPDILDEIKWNLDWMLSMQDADGGVWHKQTSENFSGFIMPEKDTLVSYVIGTGREPYKSSCATADFAAVMAIASRSFRTFDAAYSRKTVDAARKAWTWVEKNPAVMFNNPQGIATGGYGDRSCTDEMLWAAAELARTTGDDSYDRYFVEHNAELRATLRDTNPQTWGSVAPLGLWSYALGKGKNTEAVNAIRAASIAAADAIVARTAANGYRISMTPRDFVWGSNAVAANYGMQLLVANAMQPDKKYVNAALENLHYLLGRNTFSLSWLTHVGQNAFQHPHHRPSGADGIDAPWPGMLSGGPNRSKQDPAMRKLPDNLPPMKMFLDDQESYASNEIAINWNAPLVFLLAGVLPE